MIHLHPGYLGEDKVIARHDKRLPAVLPADSLTLCGELVGGHGKTIPARWAWLYYMALRRVCGTCIKVVESGEEECIPIEELYYVLRNRAHKPLCAHGHRDPGAAATCQQALAKAGKRQARVSVCTRKPRRTLYLDEE